MGVLLRDFLTRQIFGLNGLVNLSNFAFLLGFSVRDFLKLRILLLASDVIYCRTTTFSTNRSGRRSSGEWRLASSTGFGS